MQRYGRQVQTGNAHVLHNQRIYTDTVQLPNHLFRFRQFFFFQNGIYRDIDTYIVQMGVCRQSGNVFQRINRRSTCAELRSAYIYRIRTMIDGFNAALQILGGRQQLYLPLLYHAI